MSPARERLEELSTHLAGAVGHRVAYILLLMLERRATDAKSDISQQKCAQDDLSFMARLLPDIVAEETSRLKSYEPSDRR